MEHIDFSDLQNFPLLLKPTCCLAAVGMRRGLTYHEIETLKMLLVPDEQGIQERMGKNFHLP